MVLAIDQLYDVWLEKSTYIGFIVDFWNLEARNSSHVRR
jgi:hypothetical protein